MTTDNFDYGAPAPAPVSEADAALHALKETVIEALDEDGIGRALTAHKAHTAPAFNFQDMPKRYTQREWLIDRWLPAGEFGFITGRGGVGKSRLALQLAYTLATGGAGMLKDMDMPKDLGQLPVAYASYEDDEAEVGRRMSGIVKAGGSDGTGNMRFIDLAPHGAIWGVADGAHIATTASLTGAGARLRMLSEADAVRLLVIDPSAAAFYGNENDRAQVRAFVQDWGAWARRARCSVLLIAHPPKGGGNDTNYYSGSTDWEAGARFGWDLQPARERCGASSKDACNAHEGIYRLQPRKGNYAPPPAPVVWLTMNLGVWQATTAPACNRGKDGVKMVQTEGADYDYTKDD